MRYLLIYDIPHDGVRVKVADACLDYGLVRIQYSAFLGELKRTHQRELWVQIDETCWGRKRVLEQNEEEKDAGD